MTDPKSTRSRIAAALAACVMLASCVGGGAGYYKEFQKQLRDGRTVVCLSAGNSNSFTCDWEHAK